MAISRTAKTTIDKSYIAAETISALKAVYLTSDEEVAVVDPSDVTKIKAIGVAITAGTAGERVLVRLFGKLQDAVFSFTPNDDVYVASNGGLTQTAPSSGYMLFIGAAYASDALFVNIERPIKL